MDRPIIWQWDGEALVPATKYQASLANEQLVVGERYRMVEEQERSTVSHNHEFAFIKAAWQSMPDALLDQYPTSEHLRKFALIAKGHCTMVQHVCASVAEAERLAAVLKPYDTYQVVTRRGPVVTVYHAVSQSKRSMGGPQFQKSKQDILEYIAELIGVEPEVLAKQQEAA